MSRPVKRGFSPRDPNGLECNIDASHAKRQRQNSIGVVTDRLNGQQDTFLSSSSGFSDRQSAFIEPNNGPIGHDNSGWDLELQANIPDLALSFIGPCHSGISDSQLPAMLDPSFSYAEASANQTGFQRRIDYGFGLLDNLTTDQDADDGILSQDFENVTLASDTPPAWSHDPTMRTLDGEQSNPALRSLQYLTLISLVFCNGWVQLARCFTR